MESTAPRTTPEIPAFAGPVFRPGDPGYDDEVAGFQTAYTHRPAVVIGAVDAEDVRKAVDHAAQQALPVAVQATGHGLSVANDGGVLISTRRMTGILIDARRRSVRVEAGVRAGALVEAAAAHGLAPLNGSSPSVGVVGYTLGGGVGLLARQFGYAADHVRALEIVTADGRLRRLGPGDELFGAVLGSGGNFGVVTALEMALVPIREVYGGQLVFDTPLVERAVDTWRRWCAGAPDELTSSVTLLRFPDLPQVPAPLRGRYVASVRIAYHGPAEEGERLVAALRDVGPRLKDDLRTMPYTECDTIHSDPDHPHPYAATNALLRDLTPTALRTLLDVAGPDSPVPCVLDIRHLGGALGNRGPAAIAVDHREAEFVVRAISMPGQGGTDADAIRSRHARLRQALASWTVGHNLNFLYGDGGRADETQTRLGYQAATYDRLAALKAVHDPENLFRCNRNIQPRNPSSGLGGCPLIAPSPWFFQLMEVSRECTLGPVEESRRERKKRLTSQRIVMAAIRLFVEQGYEETTVAQIAAAADVDPKTFFNYFRSKDEVLFVDVERNFDVLLGAISARRPEEGPGEVLARMVQEYAAYRRPKVPPRQPAELSATYRLVLTTPALQAKGLYLLLNLQQRITDELLQAFPGQLDPITAAAMTGSLIGAIQQASLASVQLGRSQEELWEASRRGLDIAVHGLLSVRPTENP